MAMHQSLDRKDRRVKCSDPRKNRIHFRDSDPKSKIARCLIKIIKRMNSNKNLRQLKGNRIIKINKTTIIV